MKAKREKAAYLLHWATLAQANDEYGDFDPIKAQLLIHNRVVPPDVAAAFRDEAERMIETGRGTWSRVSETSKLRARPRPKHRKKKKQMMKDQTALKDEKEGKVGQKADTTEKADITKKAITKKEVTKKEKPKKEVEYWTEEEFELLKQLRANKMRWRDVAVSMPPTCV